MSGGGLEMLDAAPLRDAILRDAAHIAAKRGETTGLLFLGEQTGLGERMLRRILYEQREVLLYTADAYCARTGRHLSELYPEAYSDDGTLADQFESLWLAGAPIYIISELLGRSVNALHKLREALDLPSRRSAA